MPTVLEALKAAEARLKNIPEPRLDAEYLLAEVLGISRLEILLNKRRELTGKEAAAFEALIARREGREPLQYILGNQSFMGFGIKTDSRALIPRFDTEALCEEALKYIRPGNRVLDLCTGSGALAVAIKRLFPGAEVIASDISEDALSLAKENAERLGADVRFVQGDLFTPLADERFHVIVSNPPYIPEHLRGRLQAEVEREPALALFAGADGLDFYRRIAKEAPAHLNPGGRLCLEIGDGQGDAVKALLYEEFTDIQIINDLNGLPRVVSARIKEGKRS
ncbi:MAG: peptide chain release factor N(5)-glutamine methyltransferase [Clostridia bacterium]|nr:peptide chain release factor N(5)-glutamine methyltransferase [Clostridia bacterium]MBR4539121.1 peptide chain release factor N(5)-glutamine methyltransferase [Clostridia bacterium]